MRLQYVRGKHSVIRIAGRVATLSESVTLGIDAKAKQMQADGLDFVNLGAGEPDFETPQAIREAATRALEAGKTRYTRSAGILELREAICDKLSQDNQLAYEPSQILVSFGAKHSLFNAIQTIVDRGDQVIIPTPCWPSYVQMVYAAEGVPVLVPTRAESGFKITPELLRSACTPRTVALVINSPGNPTGCVYTPEELHALAEVIISKDILCLSDELYEKLVYDDARHVSIASLEPGMADRTLVINGFTKAFSMSGWRLGYCAGPESIIAAMNTLQGHSTSNTTTFVQWAGIEALRGPTQEIEKMREAFDLRRKYLVGRLNAIPGISCTLPQGAFYAFPDMAAYHGRTHGSRTIRDSLDLADFLLEEARTGVVPGAAFGADRHQRFSYATTLQNLEKGLNRIEEALRKLQ
jgi:aspartate aminotransferase